ncbi:hypothetical protein AAMO2058_000454500 [Amorphochlora amoebiformis]
MKSSPMHSLVQSAGPGVHRHTLPWKIPNKVSFGQRSPIRGPAAVDLNNSSGIWGDGVSSDRGWEVGQIWWCDLEIDFARLPFTQSNLPSVLRHRNDGTQCIASTVGPQTPTSASTQPTH